MKTRNILHVGLPLFATVLISLSCYKNKNDYNTGGGATSYTVSVKSTGFSPASLTVIAGSTVMWKNDDSAVHGITSSDGTISSGDIAPGSSYSKTFTTTGTFNYSDSHSSAMTGMIIVNASSGGGGGGY